jgi:hypothetical protein
MDTLKCLYVRFIHAFEWALLYMNPKGEIHSAIMQKIISARFCAYLSFALMQKKQKIKTEHITPMFRRQP